MLYTRLVSLLVLCCLVGGLVGCNSKAQIAPTGTVKALQNTKPGNTVDKLDP
ncbi:MAG: hypothetical protein QM703_17955 [Gemmatales bacterium]